MGYKRRPPVDAYQTRVRSSSLSVYKSLDRMSSQVIPLFAAGGLEARKLILPSKCRAIVAELTMERKLNALSSDTFRAMHDVLDAAEEDAQVRAVIFCGRGKAFSAGGDVRAMRSKVTEAGALNSSEREAVARHVLRIEYDFLTRLHNLRMRGVDESLHQITSIAVGDGYIMGAGAGLFQACMIRIVTEKSVMSMPEVWIGLVPDCGASHFYTSMQGSLGIYSALTGKQWKCAEMIALGLADCFVMSDDAANIIACSSAALEAAELSEEYLRRTFASWQAHCVETLKSFETVLCNSLSAERRGIDEAFSLPSVQRILWRLREFGDSEWATEAVQVIEAASPIALREAFKVLRAGYEFADRKSAFVAALQREEDSNSKLAALHDFEEGVRARLIDKDFKPRWASSLEEAEDADVVGMADET